MKNFKKAIKEALTPHYLRESVNEDLIKEFQKDGGNYRSSYQHRQPKEQLTSTDDYELFMEMFPRAEASRILMDPKRKELYDKHLEWTKEYDNNNTFVHMQYHEVEHEGEKYKAHQTQYYNGNYDDFRNPRFTELMISKDGKRMGTYLVDTGKYIEDLKNLEVKNKVSESINEGDRNFMDEAEDRINELFGIGGPSHRDIKNKAARERSANKTANYHDLLKYYQFGIARVPRHKREKATVPQAMHDRYGQEVWDILKKAYPNKGLSDTPPSDWRDSADELIMALGDEGNFEKTIYNPFYDIYAKLGPTDSHKKQLGIEEVVRGDVEIKDLHFETDPDKLEDMKIEFGAKMGGVSNRQKIEDAEYELRRYRKQIKRADLGDGPHDVGREEILKKAKRPIDYDSVVKNFTPKWTERKYEQWIEDVASGGGAKFAYEMAQNAKREAGLIDWVKKNRLGFGDVTPLERIQYDIEALAESINEGMEGKPQYYVKYTTQDGETAKSGFMSKREAIKKEEALVNSGVKKAEIWKTQERYDLNYKPYTIEDKLEPEEYGINEEGKPINESVTIPGSTPNIEGDELIGQEDLAENTETLDRSNVYPAVDKATNKLFFMTKRPEQENGKDVYVAVSKPGRQLSKAEISNTTSLCKIADKEAFGADGLFESFKPLFEQKLNPNSYELILTCGWDNKTNESKEFNFNKMIKEALTPNILK